VLHRGLPCGLGKTLGRSPGAEDQRRGELGGGGPAAAVGARTPAIVQLGLINKRLGSFWDAQGRAYGLVGVRASTGGRFALAGPMADGGARWRVRVRARSDRGRVFYRR
jgi:hypothetical protein